MKNTHLCEHMFGQVNPLPIATHEHAEMLRDVSRSTTWKDRISFVVRGPGWAARRREQLAQLELDQELGRELSLQPS